MENLYTMMLRDVKITFPALIDTKEGKSGRGSTHLGFFHGTAAREGCSTVWFP